MYFFIQYLYENASGTAIVGGRSEENAIEHLNNFLADLHPHADSIQHCQVLGICLITPYDNVLHIQHRETPRCYPITPSNY